MCVCVCVPACLPWLCCVSIVIYVMMSHTHAHNKSKGHYYQWLLGGEFQTTICDCDSIFTENYAN